MAFCLQRLHQASLKQDSLDALPLVILTREDVNDDERQQQKDLSHLSSRSPWEIAVRSGHFVQLERPDLVIAAVNEDMRPVERPPKAVSLEQSQ